MIVLDTNVVSEPLKPRPDPRVLKWLGSVADPLSVTSVTVGELLDGVRRLPAGIRRERLRRDMIEFLDQQAGSVLPFDEAGARHYAAIMEARRIDRRPISVQDAMIAAICSTRGAALATRNIKDFEGLDLQLVNPWESR